MSARIYGYARVSSQDQNLARQREALAGVDQIIDGRSAGRTSRTAKNSRRSCGVELIARWRPSVIAVWR